MKGLRVLASWANFRVDQLWSGLTRQKWCEKRRRGKTKGKVEKEKDPDTIQYMVVSVCVSLCGFQLNNKYLIWSIFAIYRNIRGHIIIFQTPK